MNRQRIKLRITRLFGYISICFIFISCMPKNQTITLIPEEKWVAGNDYHNFILEGQALTEENAEATLLFQTDGESGYEVLPESPS